MGKRKMLKNTTVFVSILVMVTLLLGTYFFVFGSLSSYNKQLEMMQKDILNNFCMKADGIIADCTSHIVSWMLDERGVEFATSENLDYYKLSRFYEDKVHIDSVNQNSDCIYGIFRPDQDVFLTNIGLIHSWRLEKSYGFLPETASYIATLPRKEFINNYYVSERPCSDGKRVNIFLKRSVGSDATTEIYGFISINMNQVAERVSQQEKSYFMVYEGANCLYEQDSTGNLSILKEPSGLIYNLTYANGVVRQSNFMIWLIYGVLFVLLVYFGLRFSSYLAKRLHRPIEDILHQLSDNGDDAELYDEAAYIQKRFVTIKAENQQLANQLNAQEDSLKRHFLRDLLYGLVSPEQILEKTEEYQLQDLCGQISLAILEERKSAHPGAADFNSIVAVLEAKSVMNVVVVLNSKQVAVICKHFYEEFRKDITQAILQIGEQQKVNYTAAVVEANISDPVQLAHLFNEAMRYLENGVLGYDKLIISKEDLQESVEYDYYYPMEFERNIIGYITDRDFERAMKLLQVILDKNFVESQLSKAAMIEFKFAIVGTVKRILHIMKKTEADLFGNGTVLYLELSACKTPEEVSEKVYEMFLAIQRYSEMADETNNYALIDSIEDYIHRNFNRSEMSLLLLAEHFNLTVSYISSIFKK